MKALVSSVLLVLGVPAGNASLVHAASRPGAVPEPAAAPSGPVTLTLRNSWVGGSYATNQPTVELSGNIVRFRGGLSTPGTNPVPFVLPRAFRPQTNVYVPVDTCGATNGRLAISADGVVTVQAQSNFANAQCFVSLEGVSFVKNATGYQAMTLLNGWTNAPFGTSDSAVRQVSGVVRFKGAVKTSGTNAQLFVLPVGLRPATNVYVTVDTCDANKGRLIITPDGSVSVQAASFANAQCFTSLDGAWFALRPGTRLTLQNRWTGGPFGTAKPTVDNRDGVVQFRGAIATLKTSAEPFVLPVTARPSAATYVKVDMCNATNGRLSIGTDGTVRVQAESDISNARCFTSLDGVSFVQ